MTESVCTENEAGGNEKEIRLIARGFDIGFDTWPNEDDDVQPAKTELRDISVRKLSIPNVKVIVEDEELECNIAVLELYSNFFASADLSTGVIELDADQVSSVIFYKIYKWMVTSNAEVGRKNITDVFNAAIYLDIPKLKKQCCKCFDYIVALSEEQASLIYFDSFKYNNDFMLKIRNMMLSKISKSFLTVVSSKEFVEMEIDAVCELLSSNSIGVRSEMEVLHCAIRWLNYDFLKREQYKDQLLKCVRFELFTTIQLIHIREDDVCPETKKMLAGADRSIVDGIEYIYTKVTLSEPNKKLTLPEPERHWLTEKFCSIEGYSDMTISHELFMKELTRIRDKGKYCWKEFEYLDPSAHHTRNGG